MRRATPIFQFGQVFGAEPESKENTATLRVENVAIELGTPQVKVPITISSEHPGQGISGIYMTVAIDPPIDHEVEIVDLESTYDSSIWNGLPSAWQELFALGRNVVVFHQITTWHDPLTPPSIPCDGVVGILTIDTSKALVPKEFRIVTDFMGYTSATTLGSDKTFTDYHPVRLMHDPAPLKIVQKRNQ